MRAWRKEGKDRKYLEEHMLDIEGGTREESRERKREPRKFWGNKNANKENELKLKNDREKVVNIEKKARKCQKRWKKNEMLKHIF